MQAFAQTSGLFLNTWHFLLLCVVAVVACRFAGRAGQRNLIVLLLNVYFLGQFLRDAWAVLVLASLLVVIFALGRLKVSKGRSWTALTQLSAIAGIWGILFLIKDPDLFGPLNPFSYHPVHIVGISYLVFRGISYLMEVDATRRPAFSEYLCYMTFFPIILAGPIERYQTFFRQTASLPADDPAVIMPALHRIANGFIKKFVLADNLANFGILAMGDTGDLATPLLWIGALSQLFLIYLDFSGYCDIVIGVALLLGFQIRENFNRPFAARNIQAFWERWHMSLSQLVRDYVFNPAAKLVFQRAPRKLHFVLIVATYSLAMILIALWHGTTMGFFIFGLVHAVALVGYQLKQKWLPHPVPARLSRLPLVRHSMAGLAMALTYAFVSLSLILWMVSGTQSLVIFRRLLGLAS